MERRKVVHFNAKSIPKYLLSVGDPERAEYIANELLDNSTIVNSKRGYIVYSGIFEGVQVGIGVHYIGGPSAAVFFEESIALGATKIIRLGTCGSLCEELKIGDIVVPPGSGHANTGGTIGQYHDRGLPPLYHSPKLTLTVYRNLIEEGFHSRLSPVVSSDAFYAEGEDFAKYYCEREIVCVEMECSILAYLGMLRKIENACILIVSDELLDPGQRHVDSIELKDKFLGVARIALKSMINDDVTNNGKLLSTVKK